jgi:hypothetical protein
VRRLGMPAAVLLVLVTNAAALLGVAANRRGEPEALLNLTERELPMGHVDEENSGIGLRLRWSAWSPRSGGEASAVDWGYARPEWFDQKKLEALGFDCSKPLRDEDAGLWYGKQLPLRRYAVLEYEGRSWTAWLASEEQAIAELRDKVARDPDGPSKLDERETRFAGERRGRSRLFLVDAGSDPGALRAQYPDRARYIVAPALVDIDLQHPRGEGNEAGDEPFLRGRVWEILVSSVHVPLPHRAVIDAVREEDRRAAQRRAKEAGGDESAVVYTGRYGLHPPRYRVALHYGTRHEPWVEGITRIEPAPQD